MKFNPTDSNLVNGRSTGRRLVHKAEKLVNHWACTEGLSKKCAKSRRAVAIVTVTGKCSSLWEGCG